ncbi:MAG: hypothetical protein COB90_09990 [Hyphomicrobiales bacterium]|nr:MAG: hypothetical protein COB90_09990 [Hyphomicrobiales bacterium]
MELWIPITIFAAFMQNIRSMLQKHLKGRIGTLGATFARFAWAAPLALLYVTGLVHFGDYSLPDVNSDFAMFVMVGGLAQILATTLLIYLFSFRNFAVGTTFSKTETVQTAVFGVIVLGETVSTGAVFGIIISLFGVVMIALTRLTLNLRDIARQCLEPTSLIGIGSGALFGVSAIGFRAASLSLESGDFVIRAAVTLACATAFQSIIMAGYMLYRDPGQIKAVLVHWRITGIVGLAGMLGSVGWFTAMTLQNAAYVRALGQVELLFTFIVSWFVFREKIAKSELAGIALVTIGILFLVLLR